MGKNLPANARDRRDLGSISGSGDPLEEGMATRSSVLAWRIPWTVEPGGLQSLGLQRVGRDRATNNFIFSLSKGGKGTFLFLRPKTGCSICKA